ncbi:hypothetical protein [Peloplasma aerotolerans]|jgi:cell division septal protein FtsQ|uniref:Uncharacterized protein n=1 Tax=Peloplasma aerotolerans TaxID=3044389 RepID=A0AAW6U915_9MOLU|nr:hypothetical protein [Mariniplasma sp. M4Ah]MDI6452952.1 hypothetical protein [Mariniplasma sp. M4Ah]MDR4968182.1 hypothetical protein [Acholeplasmataceae bacterium]
MRKYETEAEKAAKRAQARKNLAETPPEKNDILAMFIAAFIVLLPVFLIIVAIFVVVLLLLFG